MAATIATDTGKFRRGVDALAKQYGVEVRQVMLRQVSIVGGQLIKAYPPKNAKIGKNAIANDVKGGRNIGNFQRSVGVVQTGKNVLREWETQIKGGVLGRTVDGRIFVSKTGAVYGVDRKFYNPNASPSEIKAHVDRFRSKKTGRVTTAGSYTRDIGRWKFVDKLFVKESKLNAYLRMRSLRVGNLAAGWLATLNIYRGPGAGKAAAKFVSRHAPGDGLTQDQMGADGSGRIVFINRIPYASRWKRQNDFVLRKRERGMAKELAGAVKAAARKARAVA
jgi:hypothetical protein